MSHDPAQAHPWRLGPLGKITNQRPLNERTNRARPIHTDKWRISNRRFHSESGPNFVPRFHVHQFSRDEMAIPRLSANGTGSSVSLKCHTSTLNLIGVSSN